MFPRAEWIIPFLPANQYLIFATISKDFKRELDRSGYEKKTTRFFSTVELTRWANAPLDVWTCAFAAKGGHLEVLRYVTDQGVKMNDDVCAVAAHGGHLEILQWARGCHPSGVPKSGIAPWDKWTCYRAALGDHRDVVFWVHEQYRGCACSCMCNVLLLKRSRVAKIELF
jgi:hypothetical protein